MIKIIETKFNFGSHNFMMAVKKMISYFQSAYTLKQIDTKYDTIRVMAENGLKIADVLEMLKLNIKPFTDNPEITATLDIENDTDKTKYIALSDIIFSDKKYHFISKKTCVIGFLSPRTEIHLKFKATLSEKIDNDMAIVLSPYYTYNDEKYIISDRKFFIKIFNMSVVDKKYMNGLFKQINTKLTDFVKLISDRDKTKVNIERGMKYSIKIKGESKNYIVNIINEYIGRFVGTKLVNVRMEHPMIDRIDIIFPDADEEYINIVVKCFKKFAIDFKKLQAAIIKQF